MFFQVSLFRLLVAENATSRVSATQLHLHKSYFFSLKLLELRKKTFWSGFLKTSLEVRCGTLENCV